MRDIARNLTGGLWPSPI